MKHFLRKSIPILCTLLTFFSFSPIFSQNLEALPKDVLREIVRGNELEDSGKYDSASIYVEKAWNLLQQYSEEGYQVTLGYALQLKLGQLEVKQGNYVSADSVFGELYQTLEEKDSRDTLFAEVLHSLGMLRYDQSRYNESKDFLEEALTLKRQLYTELHLSVSKTYNALGNLVSDAGDYELARSYYHKALEIHQEISPEDDPNISDIYQNLGLLAYQEGYYDKAIQLIQKSFEIDKKNHPPNHPLIASSYNNLGVMYDVMGNAKRALEHYQRSLEIRRALLGEKHPAIAQSYHNMGVVHQEQGDFRQAIANYSQALAINQQLDENPITEEIASGLENMGVAYYNLKNYEQASIHLERALAIHRELFGEQHISVADNLSNIASVWLKTGKYEKASAFIRETKRKYEEISPDHPDLGGVYKKMADLYSLQEQPKKALEAYEKSYEILYKSFGSSHPQLVSTLNGKAAVYTSMGEGGKAKETYQQAIWANLSHPTGADRKEVPGVEEVPLSLPLYIRTLHEKALVHLNFEPDDLVVPTQLWELAIHWLGKAQKEAPSMGSKMDWRAQVRDICEGAIEAYLRLYDQNKYPRYLEQAFQMAEYSQAAVLHEWIQEVEAQNQANIPSEILIRENDLRVNVGYFQKKLYDIRKGSNRDSATITEYQSRLFDARRSHDSLIQAIEKEFPAYYEMKFQQNPISIREIQAQLAPEDKILRYFLTDSKLYIFSLSSKEVGYYKQAIDPSFFKDLIAFYQFIQSDPLEEKTSPADYLQLGHGLYEKLVAPVLDEGVEHLMIVPDNALGYIPFEALLTEDRKTFNHFSELPYLLKSMPISYAYSVQLLFHSWTDASEGLFMGFAPSYPLAYQTSPSDEPEEEQTFFSPLFFNLKEVQSLFELMGGKVFLEEKADVGTFKKESEEAGILHLAMHAALDDRNPLYSYLVFSPQDSSQKENVLYTYELFNMNLKANLAVLSACNTGIGEIQKGEGVFSLAKGFQYAGCPNLVTSLWQTDDKAAYRVMLDFYENLKSGKAYAEALQGAKLSYLASEDRTHPYYWATFIYMGQKTGIPSPIYLWWVLGIVGLAVLAGVWNWQRR